MNDNQPAKEPQADSKLKGALELVISEDRLSAALTGVVPMGTGRSQIQEMITGLIREKRIQNGLDMDAVRDAVNKLLLGNTLEGFVIAKGAPPSLPQDAKIEQVAPLYPGAGPDALERDLAMVRAGEVLAQVTPTAPGSPGTGVDGLPVEPRPPRELSLKSAEGVELLDDGARAVAAREGVAARLESDCFTVFEMLQIDDEVDSKYGDIDFPGFLRINEPVSGEVDIKAAILEAVELGKGTKVEVAHHVSVSRGILACEVGVGGDLYAHYIRNSDIRCQGNVLADNEIVKCNIACAGKVTVSSDDGRIANSHIRAVRGAQVENIKTAGKGSTQIIIGPREEQEQFYFNLRKELAAAHKERETLESGLVGQEEELEATELEMRDILAALKDPANQSNRDNLLGQLGMIKPIRQGLLDGIGQDQRRINELTIQAQRLNRQITELAGLFKEGAVRLVVRGEADSGTEMQGPHSSAVFSRRMGQFTAYETRIKDPEGGGTIHKIKLVRLKS